MSLATRLLQLIGIDPSNLTHAGITRLLIEQQQRGIDSVEVARQLAAIPFIKQLLPDDVDPESYWQELMKDPEARATVHPLNRGALKKYIVEALKALKEATH